MAQINNPGPDDGLLRRADREELGLPGAAGGGRLLRAGPARVAGRLGAPGHFARRRRGV